MLQNFTTAVRELQRTFGDAFNPYRPELYYMRGPGPACLAKATPKASSGNGAPQKDFRLPQARQGSRLETKHKSSASQAGVVTGPQLRARTTIASQTASAPTALIVSGFSVSGPIIVAGSLVTPPATSN